LRVLITNDDGINAPGLAVLEKIASSVGAECWTVAPESDQSGVSRALSLNDPLRLREVSTRRFAVKGTPTDCVIMGVRHLMPEPPDLVLSGVNSGQNIAEDVMYSGTIAAALEGALLGVPAIALSQAYGFKTRDTIRWNCAETHGPAVVRAILDAALPAGVVVNVNFPDTEPEDVSGIEITRQGRRDQSLMRIDARHDGRNKPYYWIGFERQKSDPQPGTDLHAIYGGRISVTPLGLDLTIEDLMPALEAKFSNPSQ
jgi:5'-nucleotidase